ncbi:protein translocase subunit SecD [Nocardioides guangzhouensis]|uniref:Protein translocase subunit SecD n=1 Tax=Nocardioides guangzhouensis TaxID=2497878 RepID=A0A4Q4Z344_9ACTN|nr:protein translocase subunit SecD [Nocardioides guangzhouensis]RYP81645.1 protein translocase subunit SecD [Nocardioides guangzhouensis]
MARKPSRPGRTLTIFGLCVVVLFGLVALVGQWKPSLGLDLQGGQRITLRAKDSNVPQDQLKEAAKIINARVNGSGVAEADVTTQGDTNIVVEIPGASNQGLVDVVQRQAQLRFRLVACTTQNPGPCATGGTGTGSSPTGGVDLGSAGANRPAPQGLLKKDKQKPAASPSASPSETPSTSPSAAPSTSPSATPQDENIGNDVGANLKWMDNPSPAWVKQFNDTTCPLKTAPEDDPEQPLVTCDKDGIKYLLSPAVVEGTELKSANAGQDQNSIDWQVQLALKGAGTKAFAAVSQALVGTDKQFAIVLDGTVISAPTMEGIISDGRASITGNFKEQEAQDLATSLKYGALPVAFEKNPKNDTIGPSLAGDQLTAGIWAGVIGLLLVMIYCLLYYRGLGLVVVASLVVAGIVTYGLVLLLSKGAGFTLSLPGIAGLIVAVGITADSFIVYFERIRDEMRDGKSMRVAVESGWSRARNTCLAADAVSLLAAVVLYIFAIDEVRGFAFTLGLSTLVDLVVFFWFTKPMVSLLATFKFFNQGHKLSGLDAENLGVDVLPGVRTAGATR